MSSMEETITVKDVPAQRVLAYRAIIPDVAVIGRTFADANKAIAGAEIPLAPSPWLALYHHEEYREVDLDFEIAIPVAADFSGTLDLGEGRVMTVRDLPAQKMACISIHLREQADVLNGNRALARWIEANGYVCEDVPCREAYGEPPLPDGAIRFESQFPIRPG
jgi:effector-binding domain-containing protein